METQLGPGGSALAGWTLLDIFRFKCFIAFQVIISCYIMIRPGPYVLD